LKRIFSLLLSGGVSMQTTVNRSKTLGVLWILFGILCVLQAVWLALNEKVLRLMWGALLERVPDPYPWMGLFNLAILCGILLSVAAALFSILGAIALMQQRGAGQGWALVAAVFGLMCGPLGIALGVYTLVLLLPRQSGPAYERYAAVAA
jgi:hypothetical protein